MDESTYYNLIGAFGAVSLAVGLERVIRWRGLRQLKKSHWSILRAEIDVCADNARRYLDGTVGAPLYRIPIVVFHQSIQALVAEGAVSAEQFKALVSFYSCAEDINRGLELTREADKQYQLVREMDRLKSKCKELLGDLYTPALQSIPEGVKKLPSRSKQ